MKKIVLAACALHNFLRSNPLSRDVYSPPEFFDRENIENGQIVEAGWRQISNESFRSLAQQGSNRSTVEAREVREELCDYFNTNGQVPWQWSAV